MATLVTAISAFVTAVISWVGEFLALFTAQGNEILLLMAVAIPVCGIGVGMLKRLLSVN